MVNENIAMGESEQKHWEASWDKFANTEPIGELESATVAPVDTAVTDQPMNQVEIMQEVLSQLKSMRQELSAKDEKIQQLETAQAQAVTAARNATMPNIAMEGWIRGTDRPAPLEEKLNVMEQQAAERGEPFNKDRTRKILKGEPVEDANRWTFMGHAFDTEEEMNAYKNKALEEKDRVVGKFPRN